MTRLPDCLAVITFAFPALFWGAAACAAPVVIHLLLRSRPRRQPFPAIRFLMASHKASTRQHRLRHLLLLALRILAIMLVVAALARPTSRGSWLSAQSRERTAAVFLIDDSASMGYRFANQTRFERARGFVRQLVEQRDRFPQGSTFLCLTCQPTPGDRLWRNNPQEVLAQMDKLALGGHDQPLAAAIERGLERLTESRLPRRELYVLTDQTQRAWSGLSQGAHRAREGVAVFVVDAGHEENLDARLRFVERPRLAVPPGVPVRLKFAVAAGDAPLSTRVEALVDGKVAARTDSLSIPAKSEISAGLLVPAPGPGLHACELRLTSTDPLEFDDSLYFALEARPAPRVAIVRGAGVREEAAVEARRVAALVCPPTMPADRRPFEATQLDARELLDRMGTSSNTVPVRGGPWQAIMLVDPGEVSTELVESLRSFVESGGLLLVIPGERTRMPAKAESLLPLIYGAVVQPETPTRLVPLSRPRTADVSKSTAVESDPATTRLVPVTIEPLTELAGDPLSARTIYRYWDARPARDSVILAEFGTDRPAIAARALGDGLVMQWAFCLDQDWSDLGIRAGPTVVLLHSFLSRSIGTSNRVGNGRAGETVRLVVDSVRGQPRADIRVSGGKSPLAESRESPRVSPEGVVQVREARPGLYAVGGSVGQPAAICAVNLDEVEATPNRLAAEAIRAFFAPGAAVVVNDPELLNQPTLLVAGDRDLDGYCFLIAMLAFLAEGVVANRFYRRAAE